MTSDPVARILSKRPLMSFTVMVGRVLVARVVRTTRDVHTDIHLELGLVLVLVVDLVLSCPVLCLQLAMLL